MANICDTNIYCEGNDSAKEKFKQLVLNGNLFNKLECDIQEHTNESSYLGFFGITNWASFPETVQAIAREVITIDSNAVVGVTDFEVSNNVYCTEVYSKENLEKPILKNLNLEKIEKEKGYDMEQLMENDDWDVIEDIWGMWSEKLHEMVLETMQKIQSKKVLV